MGKLSLMSCSVISTVAVPESPRRPWASRASTTTSYLAFVSRSKSLVVVEMSPVKVSQQEPRYLGNLQKIPMPEPSPEST